MKRLTLSIVSIATIIASLFTGCNDNNLTQSNVPPPNSQVTTKGSLSDKAPQITKTLPGRYIVALKDQGEGSFKEEAAQQASKHIQAILKDNAVVSDSVLFRYKYGLKGFSAKLSVEQVKKLKRDPRIDHVSKVRLLKLDTTEPLIKGLPKIFTTSLHIPMTGLYSTGQVTPWGVSRVNGPLDGTGKTAWVFDTGIDTDHPDLNVNASQSISYISGENVEDQVGHGTHVAGIIAAKDNSIDVVGVAAGASVVAVKVCNSLPPSDPRSGCPSDSIIMGVQYISSRADADDIVNMSFGGPDPDDELIDIDNAIIDAANNQNIRFVLSAGNDAADANDYVPARVESYNVWTVSAYNDNDSFAYFSNYGNPPIEYGGPGVSILSLWKNGGTYILSGTSMAAPHIAGLLLAKPNDIFNNGTVSNDPDGDPDYIAFYSPFGIPPGFLQVSISGPAFIHNGQTETYTGSASGGTTPYSYLWNFIYQDCAPGSNDCSQEGVQKYGGTGQTFAVPYTSNYDTIVLKLQVTGANNYMGAEDKTVHFHDQAY